MARLRTCDILLAALGALLAVSVFMLDAFTGTTGGETAAAMLPVVSGFLVLLALMAVLNLLAVLARATATAGLFIEVVIFWLSIPVILIAGLRLFVLLPGKESAQLSTASSGVVVWLAAIGVFAGAVWAMRAEAGGSHGRESALLEAPRRPAGPAGKQSI